VVRSPAGRAPEEFCVNRSAAERRQDAALLILAEPYKPVAKVPAEGVGADFPRATRTAAGGQRCGGTVATVVEPPRNAPRTKGRGGIRHDLPFG
jgi:hypothetical protein